MLIRSAIVAGLFLALWTLTSLMAGHGVEAEFDVHSLSIRYRDEWLLTPTDVPLYRAAWRDGEPPRLVRFLIEEGYWKAVDAPPQWIGQFRRNDQWRGGYAVWFTVVRRADAWIAWTRSNRDWGDEFWTRVLAELRSDDAWRIAAVAHAMEFAFGCESRDEFEDRFGGFDAFLAGP